ncbi:MAG: hypothetical protein DMF83_11855 [Acidobacteria bacterium]|nr:MAG: hypothetical protein DMF83_11855 [Acidobacteriota bacterium]
MRASPSANSPSTATYGTTTLAETDPGERAVAAARKAVPLEPSVAAHHLALVQALWTASQEADARRELQTARALASDDRERQSVQEWLDFMDRARPR